MIDEKEKTALGTSVGADAGQSIQSQTTQIIAGETPEINDLEDISQENFSSRCSECRTRPICIRFL